MCKKCMFTCSSTLNKEPTCRNQISPGTDPAANKAKFRENHCEIKDHRHDCSQKWWQRICLDGPLVAGRCIAHKCLPLHLSIWGKLKTVSQINAPQRCFLSFYQLIYVQVFTFIISLVLMSYWMILKLYETPLLPPISDSERRHQHTMALLVSAYFGFIFVQREKSGDASSIFFFILMDNNHEQAQDTEF